MRKSRGKIRILIVSLLVMLFAAGVTVHTTAKEAQAATAGFKTVKGKTYYVKSNGQYYKGWLTLGKNKYYFSTKTGVMATGWVKNAKGQYRYFSTKTGVMATGWVKNGKGKYRYFSTGSGVMFTGWVKNGSGKYRYFSTKDGIMATGWVKNGKGQMRYFTTGNGIMATGWVKNGNGQMRYFSTGSGVMATGWVKNGNGQYRYFSTSTGVMSIGWVKNSSGNQYYFDSNGIMATGVKTINGTIYVFASNGVLQSTSGNDTVTNAMLSSAQKTVMIKILYAVETGGNKYGNQDYDNFTKAYTNSSAEHAITIGAGQWYGTEAQRLLKLIYDTDKATFQKHDRDGGLYKDMCNEDWSTYKETKYQKVIQLIIGSPVGIKCQDSLMLKQINEYEAEVRKLGVTDPKAVGECINIRHQGGIGSVKRVLNKTQKPYSLNNIYKALQTDTGNQVGAYRNRQEMVYQWLTTYM